MAAETLYRERRMSVAAMRRNYMSPRARCIATCDIAVSKLAPMENRR